MIRLLLVVLFIALPATAAPITFRSGEHPTFSRIVLTLGDTPDWNLWRSEGGYRITFNGPIQSYDLSGAFERIPRTRLTALTPMADGSLQLDLGCLCHIQAFTYGTREVVIDIVDGPPPASSAFEKPLPQESKPEPQARRALLPVLPEKEPDPVSLPDQTASIPASPATDIGLAVDAARDRLLQQLSRAVGQGLVVVETPVEPTPEPDTAADMQAVPEPEVVAPEPFDHIRIETSMDSARLGLPPEALPLEEIATCLDHNLMDVASWGEPDRFAEPLAELRVMLFNEIDRARSEVHLQLARHYLYFGFGAEARDLITASGETGEEAGLLEGLAIFYETGDFPDLPELRGQTGCDTSSALWSLLATENQNKQLDINTSAILMAFENLPLHQRRLIAPALGRQLTSAGAMDTANAVMRAVTRAPGDPGRDVAALGAEIALEKGESVRGQAELMALIDANDPTAIDALLTLSETRLDEGEPLDNELRVLLQAQAFEHRGSALGDRLGGTYARAVARSGDYDAVRLAVDRIAGTPPWGRLLEDLVAESDEADFLRLALAPPFDPVNENLPAQARYAMADRLLDLGFHDAARTWIDPVAALSPSESRRTTLARLALAERRESEAQRLLQTATDEAALRLRAEAERRAGAPAQAQQTLSQIGAAREATSAVLRAGDWRRVAETGSEIEQALAGLADLQPVIPAIDDPTGKPLETVQNLIEQSAQSRAVLRAALSVGE